MILLVILNYYRRASLRADAMEICFIQMSPIHAHTAKHE